ncbi:MAG: DUF1934 domain-containing protein [Lachnospiraceae bacterium]|nr:DUF1934 domain-containing protein [Lachnospiraceae bacterium]
MEKDRKIPVNVRISGFHLSEGEDSKILDDHEGYLSQRGDSLFIVYESPEKIKTVIKILPLRVEVKRKIIGDKEKKNENEGLALISDISYEKGKTVKGFYLTPYGRLETETDTEEIVTEESEKFFKCHIEGRLKMNGSHVSDFNLEIAAAVII